MDVIGWFNWQGKKYEAKFVGNMWLLACPHCGDGIVFSQDESPHDEMWLPHNVILNPDNSLTITPSVVCPRCNIWHVIITNGQT